MEKGAGLKMGQNQPYLSLPWRQERRSWSGPSFEALPAETASSRKSCFAKLNKEPARGTARVENRNGENVTPQVEILLSQDGKPQHC